MRMSMFQASEDCMWCGGTTKKRVRFVMLRGLSRMSQVMIETNPIRFRIADLQARVASLRGYL